MKLKITINHATYDVDALNSSQKAKYRDKIEKAERLAQSKVRIQPEPKKYVKKAED